MSYGARTTEDKMQEYASAYDHFAQCIINGDIVDQNTFTSMAEIQFVEDAYEKGSLNYK